MTAWGPDSTHKDMRTWIRELEAAGELIRIDKPVDPLTQMGSLLYQSREKALLFENLAHGWRSLGQAPAAILEALARVQWYRLRVARLFFIDNSRGFGRRQQFGP